MSQTRSDQIKAASAERREQQKGELERTILEAATQLFEENGYENFSLRQVALAIGYTPTTIYLYFKDKDDLLLHVAYDGFKLFGESLQAAYDSADNTLERLHAAGWAYFDFAMSHPIHYQLMFMQRGDFLTQKPPGYEAIIDSFGVLERIIHEGVEEGILVPGEVRNHSALIWASVHGVVSLALSGSHLSYEEAKGLFALQQTAIKRAFCLQPDSEQSLSSG
ncbi:MAG: TetR/AcrR family transcriptional regulator [Trueperaceae bacterium]|nr:TetR/AcrR family transcriptional regulator [Trueperaceae bacterium]